MEKTKKKAIEHWCVRKGSRWKRQVKFRPLPHRFFEFYFLQQGIHEYTPVLQRHQKFEI